MLAAELNSREMSEEAAAAAAASLLLILHPRARDVWLAPGERFYTSVE